MDAAAGPIPVAGGTKAAHEASPPTKKQEAKDAKEANDATETTEAQEAKETKEAT